MHNFKEQTASITVKIFLFMRLQFFNLRKQ